MIERVFRSLYDVKDVYFPNMTLNVLEGKPTAEELKKCFEKPAASPSQTKSTENTETKYPPQKILLENNLELI
jgi:hypothetical protein